jgi:hypothetical protein
VSDCLAVTAAVDSSLSAVTLLEVGVGVAVLIQGNPWVVRERYVR